jgi:hypothetical protein
VHFEFLISSEKLKILIAKTFLKQKSYFFLDMYNRRKSKSTQVKFLASKNKRKAPILPEAFEFWLNLCLDFE